MSSCALSCASAAHGLDSTTAHVHSEIEFKVFAWFLSLEAEESGTIEKRFS